MSPVAPNYSTSLFLSTTITSCLSSGNWVDTQCEGFLFLRVCRSTQRGREAAGALDWDWGVKSTAAERRRGRESLVKRLKGDVREWGASNGGNTLERGETWGDFGHESRVTWRKRSKEKQLTLSEERLILMMGCCLFVYYRVSSWDQ